MEQEWSYLVEEYRAMLYRIAFSNMKNRADAEDAVQEAFLRYMKDEKPIQNKEHEKAWLIRTTIHICLDILKSGWYQKIFICLIRSGMTKRLKRCCSCLCITGIRSTFSTMRITRSMRLRGFSMKRRGRSRQGCAGAGKK